MSGYQGGAGAFMRGRRLLARTVAIATLAVATQAMAPSAAWAHDVPNEIIVRGFAKPNEDRLEVAVRVPLILLSQLDLPKRGPGYLDLERIDPSLDRAGDKVASELLRFYDGDERLTPTTIHHRISLPSEDTFDTYDQAIRHIRSENLPKGADVFWNQGFFDVYLQFPTGGDDADLSVDPIPPAGVGDRMEVLLQFVSPDGSIRTFRLSADADSVPLDPSWFQAARTFVESGVVHILGGLDHLLFLLCLVLPMRDLRRLLPVVTSFTVAHSLALFASALGWVPSGNWFPPLVEAVIAASIVYMAVENVIAPNLRRRWIVTGIFGIVHGFGFSYGLQQDFQLAGDHLLTSLFSFNVGVEIGQLIVLAIAVPLLSLLFRVPALGRFGVVVASVAIGHTGYHWMTDRLAILPSLEWPPLTETTVAALARTLVVLMLIAAAIHALSRRRQRPIDERPVENVARTDGQSGVMQRA
jgi:hypothetical protein